MKLDRILRKWTSLLLLVALCNTLFAPAASAQGPEMTDDQAINLLVHYGVIRGDQNGNLLLERGLTRAEAATVFVRAIGLEGHVADFLEVPLFQDTEEHWAQGYLHLAWRAGLMRGYGDETFRPEQPITYGEMLTVILRIIQQEPTDGQWPANVLQRAVELGIAPEAFDLATLAGAPAQRGRIFPSLARALRLPVIGRATSLQQYLDPNPPNLVVRDIPSTTPQQTITLSGTVNEPADVTVNDRQVPVGQAGDFRATVALTEGMNRINVRAIDLAGNETFFGESVTRTIDVARFDVEGPAQLQVGQSASYRITLYDSLGQQLPGDSLRVEVQGNVASWNAATSTLTAGIRPGLGAMVLRAGDNSSTFEFRVAGATPDAHSLRIAPIQGGLAVSPGRTVRMAVQVLDVDGFVMESDSGRAITVTLTGADQSTLMWDNDGTTINGSATFGFTAPATPGNVTVSASAPGVPTQTVVLNVGAALRAALSPSPRSIAADGSSTSNITARLFDQDGNAATNTSGSDISILLSTNGAGGALAGEYLTIPAGSATSQTGVTFTSGTAEGAQVIAGSVISGQALTVDSATVVLLSAGASGGAATTATKLELVPASVNVTPNSTLNFTVRVLDSFGRLVTTGNAAYQIAVTTSNNEPVVGGLPTGVSVRLGNTNYSPIDDGYAASDPLHNTTNVVGRTNAGLSTVKVVYGRSGFVTVSVVPTAFAADAVQDNGTVGPAISTLGLNAESVTVTYTGTPAKISLEADSPAFGTGRDSAAMPARSDASVTLRARLLDATDALIPRSTGDVTLTRVSGANVTSAKVTTARFVNGIATFQVNGSPAPGADVYQVSGASPVLNSNTVQIHTRTARADAPYIRSISGGTDTVPGEPYLVAPEDTHMRIELDPQPSQQFVIARVYRSNSVLFTSEPINIGSGTPVILVPKEKLTIGSATYQVTFDNGAGESTRSANSQSVANVRYDNGIRITSASYNASTRKLHVLSPGVAGGTSGGTADPAKLTIEKGAFAVNLAGGVVTMGSGNFVVDLSALPDLYTELETPSKFSGAVNLRAELGWYRRASAGVVANPDTTANPVTPLADATFARLDLAGRKLTLYGAGFTGINHDPTKILVKDQTSGTSVALRAGDSGVADGDTRFVINLSTTTANALATLNGADNVLLTQTGWTRDTRGGLGAPLDATPPVYNAAVITRAAYDRTRQLLTLTGTGFTNGTVDVTKLSFYNPATGTSYQLAGPPTDLNVASAAISFKLSNLDADDVDPAYNGASVSLTLQAGWLTDDKGRPSSPVPAGILYTNR